jgi:hypothetical protein
MTEDRRLEGTAIVLLLLTEAVLYAGSFGKFFNHDSIFYLIHAPRDWDGALKLLLSPDDGRQYRPLTILFLAPFVHLWGPSPGPYHWIPLFFHLANTWLLFRLTGRLVRSTFIALAAAWFWGLHSVTAWITYDITCISDLLSAFLLFSFLILAIDGVHQGSRFKSAAAFALFLLSLLTKETATTFPLALLLCLVANTLRDKEGSVGYRDFLAAVRRALPLTALFFVTAAAFAVRLVFWFRSGAIYTQGTSAAYDVGPLANLAGKLRYLWWALNFPDPGGALGRENLVTGLITVLLVLWAGDILLRRLRLSLLEVVGCAWFAGLCVPALMLSSRLAKWYLYVPLAGLAFMFGRFADNLRSRASGRGGGLAWMAPTLLLGVPLLLSSVLQTRGYLRNSDAAYVSGRLLYWTTALQRTLGSVNRDLNLLFLPSFEVELQDMARLLSVPPVNEGRLLRLFYPGVTIQIRFASLGDRLTNEMRYRDDLRVLQFLDGEFHDVTKYTRRTGIIQVFVLPTTEGTTPPLLDKAPQGGWSLYETFSHLELGDKGALLPPDYTHSSDLWILQYVNGHFYDVTDYWKGRRLLQAIRPFRDLDSAKITVSRREFYPDYERFATPSGRAAFFPTPSHEIVTQIGGSTVVSPATPLPAAAILRFDVAWMNDIGDGGWAEMRVRSGPREITVYKEHMRPNPRGKGFRWKEIVVDLRQFAQTDVSLILLCYNEVGRNTVSDWLNWRDIAIEQQR